MNAADGATLSVSHARINADFPAVARNATDSPTRLSDHDPTLLLLRLKTAQSADLHVAANVSPGSVLPGETATFTVDVGNGGPDAARSEEHTSELQSLMRISYAVFCLKKKNIQQQPKTL